MEHVHHAAAIAERTAAKVTTGNAQSATSRFHPRLHPHLGPFRIVEPGCIENPPLGFGDGTGPMRKIDFASLPINRSAGAYCDALRHVETFVGGVWNAFRELAKVQAHAVDDEINKRLSKEHAPFAHRVEQLLVGIDDPLEIGDRDDLPRSEKE